MRYFVVADDGNKYGPADIPTLNQWITEGRLQPGTTLMNEASGEMLKASAVTGLNFPLSSGGPAATPSAGFTPGAAQGGFNNPPGYYPRPMANPGGDGQKELTIAWVCFALSFVCCGMFSAIAGIIYAGKAESLGNQGGKVAKIANIVALVLSLLGIVVYMAVFLPAVASATANAR